MGLPLVATSDAHYVDQEDADAQDVLLCINTGKFRTDTNRMRMEGDSVLPPQRRTRCTPHFPGLEDAVARSQEIADWSTSTWNSASGTSPSSRCRRRRRPTTTCASCASQGLKERYAGDAEMLRRRRTLAEVVIDRLDRELDVINKLGFPNYFLIVWDFVRFAREQGIPGHGPRLAASARSCATRCT